MRITRGAMDSWIHTERKSVFALCKQMDMCTNRFETRHRDYIIQPVRPLGTNSSSWLFSICSHASFPLTSVDLMKHLKGNQFLCDLAYWSPTSSCTFSLFTGSFPQHIHRVPYIFKIKVNIIHPHLQIYPPNFTPSVTNQVSKINQHLQFSINLLPLLLD